MDRYVVMGNPVAHSQSPFIHAAFAQQTGQAMEYGRLQCAFDAFEPTLQAFADGGGRGCNVTMPFKFDAFRLAAAHTERGEVAGACNALRRDGDVWLGDNTDGAGLLRDIERNAGVALAGRRVLLLGAGGAAAGVLGPLLAARPVELVVANPCDPDRPPSRSTGVGLVNVRSRVETLCGHRASVGGGAWRGGDGHRHAFQRPAVRALLARFPARRARR